LADPFVTLTGVSKSFGSVLALDSVDFSVAAGEIRGLLGENGAGKSTLMNILYGLYSPDAGTIEIEGHTTTISSPVDSIAHGIGMVHQASALVGEFTAVENIMMGTPGAAFRLPAREVEARVSELGAELGFDLPLDVRVGRLTAGVKQKIEIVRALFRGVRLLILDEPTTSLVESEFRQLLASLRLLVERGLTIVFITHKIREVMEACDSVTVLRKGIVQATLSRAEMTQEEMVRLMFVERTIHVTESALPVVALAPVQRSEQPLLDLRGVSRRGGDGEIALSDVTLGLYGGEIVGVAAVSGNGEKELAEAIVHPRGLTGGDILVSGESVANRATLDVFGHGLSYTPEDRINEGILGDGSLSENLLLGHHDEARFVRRGLFIDWRAVREATREAIRTYDVSTTGDEQSIRRLSGGNIQKMIIGRAFASSPDVLVTHNPTSGLDIRTVEFIFRRLIAMRDAGGAILWINEDLDELMIASDRIAVLCAGHIVRVFDRGEFDKERIGLAMIGGAA
jgi:simple sugar transport system ATP-binding protein